jgi:hypothetical protein
MIEAICNQAFDLIGHKRHIGSIWDGSVEARIAINAWGDTRDALLTEQPWYWARGEATLALTGTPSIPWMYEYVYPSDAAKVWQVRPVTVVLNDPRPVVWRENIDDAARTLLANVSPAIAVFTVKLVDPAVWPADFTQAMVVRLAERFHTALAAPAAKQERQQ